MRTIKLNQNPKHHDNFILVYKRPLQPTGDSIWEFVGYRCIKCGRTVQHDNTVPKHSVNCKVYEKKIRDDDPIIIRNKNGGEWVPLEINQEKPLPKVIEINNDKYNTIMDNTNGPT